MPVPMPKYNDCLSDVVATMMFIYLYFLYAGGDPWECLLSTIMTLMGREEDLEMVGLMTESELVAILEGIGYQAFWGPRPVAWDQKPIF